MSDDVFRQRVMSGERVLWSGRPGQGLIFTSRDALLIPFSLVWCGFAVFWTVSATAARAPGYFTLWGVMFVCIGLYFVAGRFLADAWVRRGIRYAVTDSRVLILRSGPFGKFTAVNLSQLPAVDLNEGANGQGTIRFGPAASTWANRGGMGSWTPSFDPTPQFLAIPDARRVFDLIQQSAARSRT